MRAFKQLVYVLATGYIFVYFSEHLFWARVRPDDSFKNWISTWIVYSLMAFVFLHLITHFHVADKWALFLAGAAFGWLGEGLVVQTAYEMLPLSISFTGLAWHALITVWIGWYTIPKALLKPPSIQTGGLLAATGAGYGLWAIAWWFEPDGGTATVAEFSVFSLTITILLAFAYAMANWGMSEPFTPNRWVTRTIYGLFLLYFVFVTIPAAPLALPLLPCMLGLVYYGLRHRQSAKPGDSLLLTLTGRIHPLNYPTLLLLPLTAIAVYATALYLKLEWHTNWLLYFITTPLGFLLFFISLLKKQTS